MGPALEKDTLVQKKVSYIFFKAVAYCYPTPKGVLLGTRPVGGTQAAFLPGFGRFPYFLYVRENQLPRTCLVPGIICMEILRAWIYQPCPVDARSAGSDIINTST